MVVGKPIAEILPNDVLFDVAEFRDESEIRFRTELIGHAHERVHEFRRGHEIEDQSKIPGLILRENGFEASFGFLGQLDFEGDPTQPFLG